MTRYIDADALLQRLPDDLPYKASVKRVLMQAPTADVAPKSEFAREIFAEIDRTLDNYHAACLPVGAIEAYTYYEGGLGEAIAELKKKYTEVEQ